MDKALGLVLLVLFAAAVVGLAAGVTWIVVKVSPAEKPEQPKPEAPAG